MFSTVIFLVFIIFKAAASEIHNENPEIRLHYGEDRNKNYTVWGDKPLTIVIEDGYPRHVWCRSWYPQTTNGRLDFIPTTNFNNTKIVELFVKNVTAEMSTMWACTVLQNYVPPGRPYEYYGRNYAAKDLFFNIHVRGAKAVFLTVNSRSLTFVTANLSVNYDGEASYTYVEGEDLQIFCEKKFDRPSPLRLEYYNAAGILLFKSREEKLHLFRIVLKLNNNNYYLDCIRVSENPHREYRYRTTFLKKRGDLQADGVQHALILSVNGQELTSISNTRPTEDPTADEYIFRYIDGDVLNVTCQKKNHTVRGELSIYSNKNPKVQRTRTSLNPHRKSEAVISVNISTTTSNLDIQVLICRINNSDVLKPFAKLLFLSDVLRYDIAIQGLPRNNVLYQYTNDEKQWAIEYQYSVNETLNLTCIVHTEKTASRSSFEWKFEGESYDTPAESLTRNPKIMWSQQTFTKILDATHNTTKLGCLYFPFGKDFYDTDGSVEVIFRLKPELVSKEREIISEKERENHIVSGESSTNNDILIYSLSSAFSVAVCTILVIILIKYKRSRVQELTLPTPTPDPASVYYENVLSVFAPINEREAEAMENEYEEIQ